MYSTQRIEGPSYISVREIVDGVGTIAGARRRRRYPSPKMTKGPRRHKKRWLTGAEKPTTTGVGTRYSHEKLWGDPKTERGEKVPQGNKQPLGPSYYNNTSNLCGNFGKLQRLLGWVVCIGSLPRLRPSLDFRSSALQYCCTTRISVIDARSTTTTMY